MFLHGSSTQMGMFLRESTVYLCSSQDSVALRLWGTGWIPQIWRDVAELGWVQAGELQWLCVLWKTHT